MKQQLTASFNDFAASLPTKPLKAGCYQLHLVDLSSATVTVKFAQ
jgi:hypothetical protein